MRRLALSAARATRPTATRGVATIEFALIMPILVLLLVGICDLGLGFYTEMQVQAAAEQGAAYASRNPWNAAAITAVVTAGTGAAGITAVPAPAQVCACVDGGTFAAVACGNTCPGGSPPGLYASVGAQLEYSTVLPYPGLPSPITLRGQAYRRIK